MRTTVDIRDDVLERVKEYAAARSISNGAAVTEVLERGLEAEIPTIWENGLLVFAPGPSGAVTAEHVMKLKDEMESELS
jgi:hypothetical protein